jgi:hypothetical protein
MASVTKKEEASAEYFLGQAEKAFEYMREAYESAREREKK